MTKDLSNARTLLESGDFTCAVCLGDAAYTTRERGVKPLLSWLDSGVNLTGFSAADRVVGRGAAFLYCLLGVKDVHARVMSRPAAQVLSAHNIGASFDILSDGIINRRGDGPCPFEAAVLDITDPQLALASIRAKMQQMAEVPNMEIGIQVSSLKPLLLTQEQVRTAFSQMRGLGCRTVQLQWIDASVPIPFIAQTMEEAGIRSVSVQDFYETVMADLSYYMDLNTATGGKWLCVSRIPERLKSREGLDRFVEELRALQQKLTPLGQQLCLHPVSADFTAVPGMHAVEYILETFPALPICLDLYHLNRNCTDMPGFIRRYGSRICMVHFKDAIGDTLVPAGQGDTNWSGVVHACLDVGVPYAFVEQERWDRDPYLCLEEAMTWLSQEIINC